MADDPNPVETVLKGFAYAAEMINFMLWVSLESVKFSLFGISTATRNEQFELAHEIMNTTLATGEAHMWSWIVMYGLGVIPSWTAFYAFYLMAGVAENYWGNQLSYAEIMVGMGYHQDNTGKWVYGQEETLTTNQ
jgi:hypothetical protein